MLVECMVLLHKCPSSIELTSFGRGSKDFSVVSKMFNMTSCTCMIEIMESHSEEELEIFSEKEKKSEGRHVVQKPRRRHPDLEFELK